MMKRKAIMMKNQYDSPSMKIDLSKKEYMLARTMWYTHFVDGSSNQGLPFVSFDIGTTNNNCYNKPDVFLVPHLIGGLNNQRACLLEALIFCVLWKCDYFVGGTQTLLKLTNIDGVPLRHKYKAPYNHITTKRGPVGPVAIGAMSDLWDVEKLVSVLQQNHGIAWAEDTPPSQIATSAIDDDDTSNNNKNNKTNMRGLEEWKVQIQYVGPWTYTTPFTRRNMSVSASTSLSRNDLDQHDKLKRIVLEFEDKGFVGSVSYCKYILPLCISLLKGIEPSPEKLVLPLLNQIKQGLRDIWVTKSSSVNTSFRYIAIMWREFSCPFDHNKAHEAAKRIQSVVTSDTTIVYVCTTQTIWSHLGPILRNNHGINAVSKMDFLPQYSTYDDLPFEVWAAVDFEIARYAGTVIVSNRSYSTWGEFQRLYRMSDGRNESNVVGMDWGCE
eukprot:PhF_6_TR30180/c0_g1_i4/m.44320